MVWCPSVVGIILMTESLIYPNSKLKVWHNDSDDLFQKRSQYPLTTPACAAVPVYFRKAESLRM